MKAQPGALSRSRSGAPAAPSGAREYLAFELAREHYALPLSCVREILRVPSVTEVPRASSEVLGVISVRGTVTTVIDLRRKLQLACAPPSGKSRVLLAEAGREVMGLLVDAVLQVYRLRDSEIEPSAVFGSEAAPFLSGLGRPAAAARQGGSEADAGAEADLLLLLLDPTNLLRM